MSTFNYRIITSAGRKLLVSSLVSGGQESIEFTMLSLGDGTLSDTPSDVTNLVHHVCDVEISQVESSQEGVATIRGAFKNNADREAFYLREMGVYARRTGTSDTPILFAYANASDTADLIGHVVEGSVTEQSIVMSLVVGNASILTVDNPLATATISDMADVRKQLQAALTNHDNDEVKHITAAERTRWNDTPTTKDLSNHDNDIVKHITAAERTQWNAAANAAFLSGMIIASGCTSMSGWLLCNGQAVSRTTYAKLYNAIGTKFGAGDGSSTFNVPDLRGKFPQGANGNLGATLAAGLPNITGTLSPIMNAQNIPTGTGAFSSSWWTGGGIFGGGGNSPRTTSISFNAANSNHIYGKSNTVQPPAVAVNYFIKC